MSKPLQFTYTAIDGSLGEAALMPILPIRLIKSNLQLEKFGLLDTGATVNVLPFSIGKELGLIWEELNIPLRLSGNLATQEARAVLLQGQIAHFSPVRLAFAWTQSDSIPLILGQTNFFMEFNVCFFRSQFLFEVSAK
ncbi:MAG: hypothetical protein ACK4TA_15990 [Saprospiraceae bacterium]